MALPIIPDGADRYLREVGEEAVLQIPVGDLVLQAVLQIILLPVAWFAVALLFFLQIGEGELVLFGGAAALSLLTGLFGVVGLLRAPSKSRQSIVRVAADGTLLVAGGRQIEGSLVRGVRLGQPQAMLKWRGVALSLEGGKDAWVLGRVPPSRAEALKGVAMWMGSVYSVPVDLKRANEPMGMRPPTLAAACYLPIQGLWLIFSVAALIRSRDPAVRFAAKQSMAWFLGTGFLLLLWILGWVVVFVALTPADGPSALGVVVLVAALIPPVLLRLLLPLVAAWRAWKGVPWVIPGMGPLSRRWLP